MELEISAIELLVVFWIKPLLVLFIILSLCKWSVARSPQSCFWSMVCSSLIALVFLPLAGVLPSLAFELTLPVDLISESSWLSVISQSISFELFEFIVGALVFFCFFLLFNHAFDFLQSWFIVRRSSPICESKLFENGIRATSYSFRESAELQCPVVWGCLEPVILLPRSWESWENGRLHRVVAHEQAHIRRGDWLVKNVLYVARALFWFLPPFWVLVKRAEAYAEYACDDQVVVQFPERHEYAQDLLDFSSLKEPEASFVSVSGSELATRINLVLEGGRIRNELSLRRKVLELLLALLLIPSFYALEFICLKLPEMENNEYEIQLVDRRVQEIPDVEDVRLIVQPYEEASVIPENVTRYRPSKTFPEINLDSSGLSPEIHLDSQMNFEPDFVVSVEGLLPASLVYPEYPKKALERGIEARVLVRFDVDPDGRVSNIRLEQQKNNDHLFVSAIRRALTESRFSSPKINGESVAYVNAEEVFVFQIKD